MQLNINDLLRWKRRSWIIQRDEDKVQPDWEKVKSEPIKAPVKVAIPMVGKIQQRPAGQTNSICIINAYLDEAIN